MIYEEWADMATFGTADRPIRASSIPTLMKCTWRHALMHVDGFRDDSGPAADTGTAVHKLAEYWHLNGQKPTERLAREALAHLREVAGVVCPLADLADAEDQFRHYILDPRNQEAVFAQHDGRPCIELEIAFDLPPHPSDPTGRPIRVLGHLDQLRIHGFGAKLDDIKTSKKDGPTLMAEHAYQIAAYCVGATEKLGFEVHPGAIIRTRGYRQVANRKTDPVPPQGRPPAVFFNYPWTLRHARAMMQAVALRVAEVRAGRPIPGPGDHCNFCLMGQHSNCVQEYADQQDAGRVSLVTL